MANPIEISLLQPTFFGPQTPQSPITIINVLTNEAHGYQTVQDVLEGQPFFDFNGWPPSIYTINNTSTGDLPVVLFEKSYVVHAGQFWKFIAHDEIGSHIGWMDTGQVSLIIQSFWDTSLGGSIWDGGASLWDVFPSGPGSHP